MVYTFIKTENKIDFCKDFSDNQINYVGNFFDRSGKLKSWLKIMPGHSIRKNLNFKLHQLIDAAIAEKRYKN